MTDPTYRKSLKVAEKELLRQLRQREELERQIARTRQTVVALRMKVEADAGPLREAFIPRNLTDACRWVLTAAARPLDAPTVRDRVEALGFSISSSNPLASVHSILRRLIEQGEVREAFRTDDNGIMWFTRAFWWGDQGPIPDGWTLPTSEQLAAEWKKHTSRGASKKGAGRKRKK